MTILARQLRPLTPARVGLEAAGSSLATREWLALAADHALAKDAVEAPFDADRLSEALIARRHPVHRAQSSATTRRTYLERPDLGRRLLQLVPAASPDAPPRVVVVVADGLAPHAAANHALPLLDQLRACAPALWQGVPVVVATQARVALGDAIGEAMGAAVVVMLIGERPGLSAHDSLGAYLTWQPRMGRTDAERNCVSNIRPAGLACAHAAWRIHWLVSSALERCNTGIALKDESGTPPEYWMLPHSAPPEENPP